MKALLRTGWVRALSGGLLLTGLLSAPAARAQTADTYTFAPNSATFAPLPTSATAAPDVEGDDVLSAALPLGFSFVFDGTTYTSCKVSSNGWLTFNPAASSSDLGNDLTTGPTDERPRLAPFWDDLNGSNGTARYLTTGTAPNRTFTFEWANWIRYGNTTGPSFSMQVQLVEGSNIVRFAYTQLAGAPISSAAASIGLSGAGTGSCSFLALSDATANPSASSTTENDAISVLPPTNQVYTFTPPAPSPCPTPRCLAMTSVTATTATVTYTVTNTTPGPFTIIYGPAGFNPAAQPSATNVYATSTASGTTANLSGLTPQTGYQFYVVQTCGGATGSSVRSNAGSFTTNPTPAANDECTTAVPLTVATTCTTPTSGSVFGATQSLAPTSNCGGNTANDVWYSFVATSTSHTITMTPQFDAAYDVRSGACASTISLFCATINNGVTANRTIGGLTVGQTYFIRIYSSGNQPNTSATSAFTLCVVPGPTTPVNDDCAGAINVPVQFVNCITQVSADNTAATSSTVLDPTCASYQGNDLWFKVTVPVTGTVSIQTVAPTAGSSVMDTGMSVYSGSCATLTLLQCDDDGAASGNYSQIDLSGRTPGEVLYIRVWSYGNNTAGPIAVCVTSPSNCAVPTGPTVTGVTNTSAVLNWVAPSSTSTGNTYEIEYGLQNFIQGTGTVVTGLTGTSTTINNLLPNTAYCFYVRQNCGAANGSSAYTGTATCFTTPQTIPANDEPCAAVTLGTTVLSSTTVGATTSAQTGITTPICSPARLPQDVWFAFTAAGVSATFTLTGTAAGQLRVYSSPSCSAGPFALLQCAAATASNTGFTAPVVINGLTTGTRYYVAVSGYGSSDPAGPFTIAVRLATGARAQAETDALLVYPNPSSTGQLTLKLAGLNGTSHATLLNALGQVVLTKNLTAAAEQTLSTHGLAAGLYTLRVDTGTQVLTRKVVLE